MSAVIFALLLVATALGLERYSTVHSLDDVQGRLEVEDHLVEAGARRDPPCCPEQRPPLEDVPGGKAPPEQGVSSLHGAPHYAGSDRLGPHGAVHHLAAPGAGGGFLHRLRLERRGRYVLEPMQVIGGDFLGLVEQSRTERGFHELIVPPGSALCRNWKRCWAVFWASFR
mgnify:CR=1 FL=1